MRHIALHLFAVTLTATASFTVAADEIVIADFEGKDYSPWKVEGKAFEPAPTRAEALTKWRVTGWEGQGAASSGVGDGKAVGTLTSPPFKIERKYINFLIAGGSIQADLHVDLLLDGAVVRTATGTNKGSMTRAGFDVTEFRGKAVRIRIVDNCARGKSANYSIQVDQIEMSDVPAGGVVYEAFSLVSRVGGASPRPPARSDVVYTLGGRLAGKLELTDSGLRIGGRAVASADLLYAARLAGASSADQSDPRYKLGSSSSYRHVVRLTTGEAWRVNVESFESQKLTVRGDLVGSRVLDAKTVAAVELMPGHLLPGWEAQTLYCTTVSEPIPGKMLWIRSSEAAIACPLGVVRLATSSVVRYVFSSGASTAAPVAHDEVALIDGTRFRGRIESIGKTVELTHPILEKVSVPESSVLYILRSHERAHWLGRLPQQATRRVGPTAVPPGPKAIDCRPVPGALIQPAGLWLIRMQPQTTVRYRMPPRPGGRKATFHAIVAPRRGNRGSVRATVSVSGRRIFEKALAPSDTATPVKVDLPAGDGLDISVDFIGKPAYPCVVEWRDAHILLAPVDKPEGARQ